MVDFESILFAYLEEDNLERAFFSVKPLLTLGGHLITEQSKRWPDRGTLRVVPDRNEQYHFKGRIRAMGHYCMIDMSRFPAAIQKIRLNKNYDGVNELNQHIIYSDTIFSLPVDVFYQVLSKAEWGGKQAITPKVFLKDEAGMYGPVEADAAEMPTEQSQLNWEIHEVQCPDGIARTLACNPSGYREESVPYAFSEDLAHGRPAGVALQTAKTATQVYKPAMRAYPKEEGAARSRFSFDLSHTEEPVERRPKNQLQALVAHQWKDQLETPRVEPLPADLVHEQVENPVETALSHLRHAWVAKETQPQLAEAILALPGVDAYMISGCCKEKETPLSRVLMGQLRSIEAERLALLVQLDKCKAEANQYRCKVRDELAAEAAGTVASLKNEADSLREAISQMKAEAAVLQQQREVLEESLSLMEAEKITGNDLLARFLLPYGRSGIRLKPIPGETSDIRTVIDRVMGSFAKAGLTTHRDAVSCMIYLFGMAHVFGIVSERLDTMVPMYENLMRCVGWTSSFGFRTRADQPVYFADRGHSFTPCVIMSAVADGDEVPGATEAIVATALSEITASPRYKLHPYPVMTVVPLSHVPVLSMEETETVLNGAAIRALDDRIDPQLLEAVKEVLAPVLTVMDSLPDAYVNQLCRFVAAVSPELEGGLAVACDFGILWWLLPMLCAHRMDKERILPLLGEYPLSRKYVS